MGPLLNEHSSYYTWPSLREGGGIAFEKCCLLNLIASVGGKETVSHQPTMYMSLSGRDKRR